MSAFICSERHIATCAAIVADCELSELREMAQADLACRMAMENMASVAWRYGQDGQAAYAEMMGPWLAQLAGGLSEDYTITSPGAAVDGLADMLPEGISAPEHLFHCRVAKPVVAYSLPEAVKYLACLAYQSCEHPQWEASDVNRWIIQANGSLARRMAEASLDGRHIWEVE